MEFSPEDRKILLAAAKDSIGYALDKHTLLKINSNEYPSKLQAERACFVTLHIDKNLRGCIGSLFAKQALILDVNHNAYNAAFNDPRFPGLTMKEFANTAIEISVLSIPTILNVKTEDALLRKLRPGIDGLILSDQGQRATFLPTVWEQVSDPKQFVTHLKNKAGWANDYWSDSMQIETYTTELIS